jgi:hypothetical protein
MAHHGTGLMTFLLIAKLQVGLGSSYGPHRGLELKEKKPIR